MYFKECQTVVDIKSLFRKLAMENHPDRGGSTEVMQEINAQYQAALRMADGQASTDANGKEHKYYYRESVESATMEKILEILGLCLPDIEIALVGTWIWVGGNTRPHKDLLGAKGIGLKWHNKRCRWYYAPPGKRSRYAKRASFSDLAASYGYKEFRAEEKTKLN